MRDEQDRFEADASRYADYLQTTEGRLRLDLAWTNLLDALAGSSDAHDKRALDVGGGTGTVAVRLAVSGWSVAVVDGSAAMLALAAEAARHSRIAELTTFHHADASELPRLFAPQSFDLVICHNVLEYVADPHAVFRDIGALVARPHGLVSVLARNRAGEAIRAAVKNHDLVAARRALTAESVTESLYGGPARLFDAASLSRMADDAKLDVIAVRGVRVLADYLPPSLAANEDDYRRLLDFEHNLGALPDFAAIARYTQIVARSGDA